MTKLRWPENSIEHQNVHGRPSSSSSASICIRVYTREADFHKPEIYGGRVRDGLPSGTCFTARRHEVVAVAGLLWIYFVVCFLSGRISYFFRFICFERTRPTASTRQPCLMYLSTSTGVRTGYHYLISLSVCLSVCVSVCITFVVFTDCESCTRPISTNPVSMEAGEYGLTRGTWVFARHLEEAAVARLLWM